MGLSDAEFVRAWAAAGGSPARMSEQTGITLRQIYRRRARMEERGRAALQTNPIYNRETPYSPPADFVRRRQFEVPNGTVVIFSDPHFYPDHSAVGIGALCKIIREVKPVLVVCGGDAIDGTQLGRFPPVRGHHQPPGIREQLECAVQWMGEIQAASGKAQFAWTLGNHDVRLSRHIAVHAPEILDLPYTRLEDWLPAWWLSWTVEINAGKHGFTVIRHRNQAGMLHLQAQKAGCHYVHGHLHRLNVHRQATYNGVRYSVDCGSLADPTSDAFDYAEGAPEHAQGFAVLTYKDGRLLPPELCEVIDQVAYFRGQPV